MTTTLIPRDWHAERTPEIVAALWDAFHDYPVMRYIVGEAGSDYDRRLDRLIGFFVARRVAHDHPILALEDEGRAVAVATLTPPGDHPESPEVAAHREALWRELGPEAQARSERLIEIWTRLEVPGPQYHLNMLGVRRSHAGRGLGRLLLDAVHDLSRRDPISTGVSLSTEDPKNVLLYEHCGYQARSHERVTPDLETWILFRPDDPKQPA